MKCLIHQAPTGNRLTDAYMNRFQEVAHLYDEQNPTDESTYDKRAKQVVNWFSEDHRNQLVDTLTAYHETIGASESQKAALARLRLPDSVAVVTGQQAGLLTGPFYSVAKALSAIGVASEMERLLGRPVVPVFWIASEDHDFAEVDHAYVLNHQTEVERIRLSHHFDTHQMVYHASLTEEQVEHVMEQLQYTLAESPNKGELLHTVQHAWTKGDSLATWFARLMSTLLSSHPIVFLDPCLPGLRQLVKDVFARTLSSVGELQAGLEGAYQSVLEAGFEPEVIRDPLHTTVFHVVEGRRYVIETTDSQALRARGQGKTLTVADWVDLAQSTPDAFSSNVLLRPVIQDHLLPTLAYVGGPSELAYYPLSRAVFHLHDRVLPPLILRGRYRIAPPGVARAMRQFGIEFEAVRTQTDLVRIHALDDVATRLESELEAFQQEVTHSLHAIRDSFLFLGPQVNDMVQYQVEQQDRLKQRLYQGVYKLGLRRKTDDVQQLLRIERWMWTDGHEQERRLSPMNLWAELGLRWFSELPTWGHVKQMGAVLEITVE